MSQSVLQHLEFDDWVDLARTDPASFEALRARLIDEAINRAPSAEQRRRLRGLQWRVDMVRSRSRTPIAACLDISAMMWDALLGEDGMVNTLRSPRRPARTPADVVTLSRPPES